MNSYYVLSKVLGTSNTVVVQSLCCVWVSEHSMPGFLVLHYPLNLLKLMSIESVMSSNHLILCHPLLLLPSISPSIRVFFPMSQHFRSGAQSIGDSTSASILPVSIQGWFLLRLTGLISLLFKRLSTVLSSTTVRKHQFFGALPSLWSSSHNSMWPLERL